MNFLFLLAALAIFNLSFAYEFGNHFGFGVQKLRHSSKNILQTDLTATTPGCENVTEHRFTKAVIDNFAPIEEQVYWKNGGQRYFMNRQFWGGKNYPIFVFIGGEGEEKCTRLTNRMYVYQLAQEHKALLLDVEHRFYGRSLPTDDVSTENLKYHSSSQALADLARLVSYVVNEELESPNSKIISVGGSYPGNLAAWFRIKYPSVTHASIASSAPVHALVDFYDYMNVVGQALIRFSGQQCFNNIELAAELINELALTSINQANPTTLSKDKKLSQSTGLLLLDDNFALCSDLTYERDLSILLSDLMGNIQGTVQYNNENNGVYNVTDICNVMTAEDISTLPYFDITPEDAAAEKQKIVNTLQSALSVPVPEEQSDAYYNFVKLAELFRTYNGQECEDGSYQDTINYMSDVPTTEETKFPISVSRTWTYQTCNEFGYYQTANSKVQPFSSWELYLDLSFYRDLCYDSFSQWKSDPQVDFININYGDVKVDSSNIVFVNGNIDPWHALGVTNTTNSYLNDKETNIFIDGTAHCHDLYKPANSDPASLTAARETIAQLVDAWLN